MGEGGVSLLTRWESFYVITGSAAAALTGLQFVVIVLGAEMNRGSAETNRAFGTPTIVHCGLPRTTPLNYSTDGDRIIVIASKVASPTHPDWYHNLVAHPEVTIEIGTEKFPVRAHIAEGQERERLFNAQAALMPSPPATTWSCSTAPSSTWPRAGC